jgi:hypothetical protein
VNADNRWKQHLKGDPMPWLLEPDNPSVRYFALTDLLDRPADDPEVTAARHAIMAWPLVQLVLRRQRPDGRWGSRDRAYGDTLWRLLCLALLGTSPHPPSSSPQGGRQGMDGGDAIHRACDYVLKRGPLPDGCFSFNGQRSGYLPCYTANTVFLLCQFGYASDSRVEAAVSCLCDTQLDEGGWLCSGRTRKTHSCLWATAKVLRAFACLPRHLRSTRVAAAEQVAIELFLACGLYKSNRRDFGAPHPHWFLFGFPLLVESDVLEVLSLIAPFVPADDPRIQEGLDLVLSKQDDIGRWPLEKSIFLRRNGTIAWQLASASNLEILRRRFGNEQFALMGRIGEPSKWVTLNVLRMLKRLYKMSNPQYQISNIQ